ncbi:MAG: hypothetical protein O7G88_22065 [bacterium]|nr:hypothetical protein [bacterium]
MMKVAMLRIGIDTGTGGLHGPLFRDGTFEYVPIPDGFGIDTRTFGNTMGRHGKLLIEYFPPSRQAAKQQQSIHVDPEFTTFTYGDPSSPKAGLRRLERGDMLIFYCGLEGWNCAAEPALYLMGYFDVSTAGRASDYSPKQLKTWFGENSHVRHPQVYLEQERDPVLVKGTSNSRLLTKAVLMSTTGEDRSGRPIKVLSEDMQKIFGGFNGRISFQRSPTRRRVYEIP